MSKRAKIALGSVAAILILVAVAAVMVGSRLDSIFAGLIERTGSDLTGTSVRVEGVTLELREGRARIGGLTVANPPGYSADTAISIGNIEASVDPGSLTSDVVVVREVIVENTHINLEQRGAGNNLREILGNVRGNLPEADPDEQPRGQGKKVVIDSLRLTDATVMASAPQLDETRELTLSEIVVRDIGRQSNGATAAEVAARVLEPVLSRALDATAREILRGERLQDAAGELFDRLNRDDAN